MSSFFRASGVRMPSLWPFLLLFLIVPAVLTVVCAIAYKSCIFTVTNKRILYRYGLFSRTEGELPLSAVESLAISEPLLGRLLGFGKVIVTTTGGAVMPFSNIREPRAFHAKLQRAIEESKRPARRIQKPVPPSPQDDSRYMPKN